jgi:hypothetical protein
LGLFWGDEPGDIFNYFLDFSPPINLRSREEVILVIIREFLYNFLMFNFDAPILIFDGCNFVLVSSLD